MKGCLSLGLLMHVRRPSCIILHVCAGFCDDKVVARVHPCVYVMGGHLLGVVMMALNIR